MKFLCFSGRKTSLFGELCGLAGEIVCNRNDSSVFLESFVVVVGPEERYVSLLESLAKFIALLSQKDFCGGF